MEPGSEAVLAVKVGFTRLSAPGEGPEGSVKGVVERIVYEGATVTVEVSAGALGLVSSKLPSARFEEFSVGAAVDVSWPADKATVFQMPAGGLEEEMRLDRWQGSS